MFLYEKYETLERKVSRLQGLAVAKSIKIFKGQHERNNRQKCFMIYFILHINAIKILLYAYGHIRLKHRSP